jgi:phosphatidylglycerophosphate synthase
MPTVPWRELLKLPNVMSWVRFPLAALLWVAPNDVRWLVLVMIVAAVTDLLDGWLARRAGMPAEGIGAWLDPLCDKAFMLSVLIVVWVTRQPPVWMAVVASARELAIFPLVVARFAVPSLRAARIPWRALALGKAATVLQFALFAAVLLELQRTWLPLSILCGLLGVGAGVQYGLRALSAVSGHQVPHPRPSV